MSATIAEAFDMEAVIVSEIAAFLSTRTTTNIVDGLNNYPTIKRIFLKYNCIRSTEAICERLFSYAGKSHITPTRNFYVFCVSSFVYCQYVNCPVFVFCLYFIYNELHILVGNGFRYRTVDGA